MKYYDIIAIYISPLFGLLIMDSKYKFNLKSNIFCYLNILLLTNLLTTIIVYIIKGYVDFVFGVSFFVKYSLMNIAVSILVALVEIAILENVKVKLEIPNEK